MNQYIEVPSLLVTGMEFVSPHLAWLIRSAVLDHCGSDNIDLIAFRENVPDNQFGIAFAGTKSMVLNMEMHALTAMDKCMLPENMNASMKVLFLHELLDTAIHEADHLLSAAKASNWNSSDLNEDSAKTAGKENSWLAAKKWDVDIKVYGPVVDKLFGEFIDSIREDTKDATAEVSMWRELQLFMWDNNLGYYDPQKDLSLGITNTFEGLSQDEQPWISDPIKFISTIMPVITERAQPSAPVEVINPPEPIIRETISYSAPMAPAPPLSTDEYYEGFDTPEYDGSGESFEYEEPTQAPAMPAPAAVVAAAPAAPVAVDGVTMAATQIKQIAEKVLRTLFWHVQSKCEFTNEGGYNNAAAVLEPVRIDHIPGALQLFTHMNTIDAKGVYANHQPTTMGIKGLLTKDGLPSYKLFLRMNGTLHYRTLLPVNPNKVDTTGNYTKWAQAARSGTRIMYLMEEDAKKGIRADIKLLPGKPLGQEEFNVWGVKQ